MCRVAATPFKDTVPSTPVFGLRLILKPRITRISQTPSQGTKYKYRKAKIIDINAYPLYTLDKEKVAANRIPTKT